MNESKIQQLTENSFIEVSLKTQKTINYNIDDTLEITVTHSSSFDFLENFSSFIKDVFLPKGYPETVSNDYLEYQIWDTCQAFCSCISGTLAMRAVMQGIGVGSEAATPVSAAVTWLIKDGTGMLGSILFTWLKGGKLDSDCKKWRFFADVLNDIAMFIELSIPFKMEYSKQMMCIATVFKALVGTAGSSTRAAIITHQAIKGNIADVSAKDGSQEIFTNLCAFIFGIFILKNITKTEVAGKENLIFNFNKVSECFSLNPAAGDESTDRHVWSLMYTATMFHLIFNYKALKCLNMNIFNKERYCLCLRTYFPTSSVPSVAQVNKRESAFLFQGVSEKNICGFSFKLGACLKIALQSNEINPEGTSWLFSLFQNRRYFIFPHLRKKRLYVSFHRSFREQDVLKAYFHASLIAISINYVQGYKNLRILKRSRKNSPIYRLQNMLKGFQIAETELSKAEKMENIALECFTVCDYLIDKEFVAFLNACDDQGWRLSRHLLTLGDWRGNWKTKKQREIKFQEQGFASQASTASLTSVTSTASLSSTSLKPSGSMHLVIS